MACPVSNLSMDQIDRRIQIVKEIIVDLQLRGRAEPFDGAFRLILSHYYKLLNTKQSVMLNQNSNNVFPPAAQAHLADSHISIKPKQNGNNTVPRDDSEELVYKEMRESGSPESGIETGECSPTHQQSHHLFYSTEFLKELRRLPDSIQRPEFMKEGCDVVGNSGTYWSVSLWAQTAPSKPKFESRKHSKI